MPRGFIGFRQKDEMDEALGLRVQGLGCSGVGSRGWFRA